MLNLTFTSNAWQEYCAFRRENPALTRKLEKLLDEMMRHPFEGSGKPEALRYEYTGMWSRRIDQKNRLVYEVTDEGVKLYHCGGHYGDR